MRRDQAALTFMGYFTGMIRAVVLALVLAPLPAMAQPHAQADVSACFVPEERCTGQIVAALDGARTEIRVQAFFQLEADRRRAQGRARPRR